MPEHPIVPPGPPDPVWQSARHVGCARPGLLAVFLVCFLGVFFLVVMTATLITFILPESYVSEARVILGRVEASALGGSGAQAVPDPRDPRFIKTQCDVISSELILNQAITNLDLNVIWGGKYADGNPLRTSETVALLRGRMDVRPVGNASIIVIRIYSEKPDEAAKIANAIAEAYRDSHTRGEATGPGPYIPPVQIMDHAMPAVRPVRPNKPLNIGLGIVIGLVLGLLAGAGACLVSYTIMRKRPPSVPGRASVLASPDP